MKLWLTKMHKISHLVTVLLVLVIMFIAVPAKPARAVALVSLSETSGPVGTQVFVSGDGFTAGNSFTVTFYSSATGYNQVVANGIVAAGGLVSTTFVVPEAAKATYTVQVNDFANTAFTSFTITPNMVLDKTSDKVGTQVTISGKGFGAIKTTTIYFDNDSVATAQTNTLGTLSSVSFTVPKSSRGTHVVKAQDSSSNQATANFITLQTMTMSPTSGTVDDDVTVAGDGFQTNRTITVTIDGNSVTTGASDAKGSFSMNFKVPAVSSGAHQVKASDGSYDVTASFTVAATSAISETSGYPGTEVTVTGEGFASSKAVTITFGEESIDSVTTDSKGSFSATFFVPASPAGTYEVKLSDGQNQASFDFTINLNMQVSKPNGYVGMSLTISGAGFIGLVSIKYDDVEITKATVQPDGSFRSSFDVPVGKSGPHQISVSDGNNTLTSAFEMESTPPEIPQPLLPAMGVKSEALAVFDWEDVTDDSLPVIYTLQIASDADFKSIVLEKKGLTESGYALTEEEKLLSVKKETPYRWRVQATDAAGNESGWTGTGTFYVGGFLSNLSFPTWGNYVLMAIGGLVLFVIGVWVGRRTSYF